MTTKVLQSVCYQHEKRTLDLTAPFKLGEVTVTPKLNNIESSQGSSSVPPKVMKLLLLLLEKQGEPVSQQAILDALWSRQVVSDSSIYQAVAQLRKALGDDKSKGIVERISGQGYRITLSPAPIHSIRPSIRPNWWLIVTMVVLFIALGTYLFRSSEPAPEVSLNITSLTITPLAFDVSANEQLASSVRDVLITRLVPIKTLTVINHENSDGEIHSDAVLTGRVYQSDQQTRVSISLTRVPSQQVIWAKLFTSQPGRTPEQKVAEAVLSLFDQGTETTTSPLPSSKMTIADEAYEQYLLARYLWNKRSPESLNQARSIYEQVADKNQLFPLAAVGLCETYYFLHLYSDWSLTEAVERCDPLLNQALEASPDLGQALAASANLLTRQKRYEQAHEHFQRAIELAPNYALGHYWYGFLLREQGHYQQSIEKFKQAYLLDPMSPAINLGLAYAHLNLGQIEKARHYYQRSLTLNPDNFQIPVMDLDFYPLSQASAERFLAWIANNQKILTIQPNYLLTNVMVLLSQRQFIEARLLFDTLQAKQVNPAYRLFVEATLHAAENNHEQALTNLQERYLNYGKNPIYALPLATQLAVLGYNDQALDLLKKHFNQALFHADTINQENSFLLVFWLSLQASELTPYQQDVREKLDSYFANANTLLSAEWWAYRGQPDKVRTYLKGSNYKQALIDFSDDHLLLWRLQRLESIVTAESLRR